MDELRKQEILASESPFRALFGNDTGRRGRKTLEHDVMAPHPDRELVPDRKDAHRITMKIHFRTLQVLKHLYVEDFKGIFEKEMALELKRIEAEKSAGTLPAVPVLKRRRAARNGK